MCPLTGLKSAAATLLFAAAVLLAVACAGSAEKAVPEPTVQLLVGTPPPFKTPAPTGPQVLAGAEVVREPSQVSLDWLEQAVEVPPLPAFAPAAQSDGLLDVLRVAMEDADGRASVVVRNLEDGRYAAVDEHEVYYAASTFKLGILLEAFRQRDAGTLDFGQLLTLEQKYTDEDLGTLDLLGLHTGDLLTVADAVKAMVIVSDTPCAVLLQDTVGGQSADATLRTLGIEDTSFNNRALPATAADMATLLQAIAAGTGVTNESGTRMLELLVQEGYRDGVAAGVPERTVVAHKTGSYNDATHDIALVWGPAGPYVIAVMTDQPNNWPLIAGISKAVWDYFSANP